jgi:hypothetical protein
MASKQLTVGWSLCRLFNDVVSKVCVMLYSVIKINGQWCKMNWKKERIRLQITSKTPVENSKRKFDIFLFPHITPL